MKIKERVVNPIVIQMAEATAAKSEVERKSNSRYRVLVDFTANEMSIRMVDSC